jgi:Ca2+-binding RTX toxin-like protein
MSARQAQHGTVAFLSLLVALLAGVATLRAAIGGEGAVTAPPLELSASGSIALSNSDEGEAIFNLPNIGPGGGGQGQVTIANNGTAPGALVLTSRDRADLPGRYGGTLSERLELGLYDVSSGSPSAVYVGQLGAMPELRLGTLAAGEARTYRFAVTMLDGGAPGSPFVDDNVYQRGATSIGYDWALIEVEPGEPEPPAKPPVVPPASSPVAPPAPAPVPAPQPAPGSAPTGTPRADLLVGTAEDDVIFGRGGPDRIFGNGGQDRLDGGPGADRVSGGPGADRLRGGAGRDRLNGGPGPDLIFARGGGADIVNCGGGRDRAQVDERDRVSGCERVQR